MTSRRPDDERDIRDWLSDSAPRTLPPGLRTALEGILSEPPNAASAAVGGRGHHVWGSTRTVMRLAAVLAVLAIIGGLALLHFSSPYAASPSVTASANPSYSIVASPTRTAQVTRAAGSSWTLVDGALPLLIPGDEWLTPPCPVFARPGGGFVAFVSTARGEAIVNHAALAAPAPSAAATPAGPRETEVFTSPDGVTWTLVSTLPTLDATVADMVEAAGVFVAVGWAGQEPPLGGAAEIWTSRDLRTWSASDVSRPEGAPAEHVVYGPAGFLVWGVGNSEAFPYDFWISKDGSSWQPLTASGLPNAVYIGAFDVRVLGNGYTIYDGTAVWRSTDAVHWARAWAYTGPGASPKLEGDPFVALGPVFAAGSGGFVSFGRSGNVSGGPTPGPEHILTWTSSDGIQWSPGKTNFFGVNLAFASDSDGFIAAGAQPAADDTSGTTWGKLAAWRTSDGGTWTAVADLPTVGSTDVLFNSSWLPGPSAVEVVGVVGDGTHVVIVCLDASGLTPGIGARSGNLRLVVGP
jgi:hypothetical protein